MLRVLLNAFHRLWFEYPHFLAGCGQSEVEVVEEEYLFDFFFGVFAVRVTDSISQRYLTTCKRVFVVVRLNVF